MPGVKVLQILSDFEVKEVIEERKPWVDAKEVHGICSVHSMICEKEDEVKLYRDDLKTELIGSVCYVD